jgi:cytochrome c
MIRFSLVATLVFALAANANAADVEKGKTIFEKCAACHSLESGKNENAPTLSGIFGRKIASVEDYRYSAAMKRSDVVWAESTLNSFLEDPQAFIPGNRMPFDGLKEKSDRDDLLAYLMVATRVASLKPVPLPYIDGHSHIVQHDPDGAVALILSAMEPGGEKRPRSGPHQTGTQGFEPRAMPSIIDP